MEKNRHTRIKVIFIFASVLVLSLSLFSYLRINNLMKTASLVNHTNVVKLELESLFSEVKGAESAQRGYILTHNKVFINQFNKSMIKVRKRFQNLERLTNDNYSQKRNSATLSVHIEKRLEYMKTILLAAESQNIDTNSYIHGMELMENLRIQIDKMMDEEDFLLRIRTKSLTKESALTPLFTVFLIVCSLLVLAMSYYGINFELKISNALKRDLEANKRDLQQANESLQKSNQEIALSRYNKLFLTEFSEKFSNYKVQNEFFNSLVQYIGEITGMDYVFVGNIDRTHETIQVHTLAVSAFGKLAENYTYPINDGPCEQLISGVDCAFPKDCELLFPENEVIKKLKVSGYVGFPLFDSDATAIGIIAVMHQSPIDDTETLTAVLKIVAKRAEMEILRIKNEQLLASKNSSLEETNVTLARMNKELESFTYISSHDLQEPLRKIQTFITRIMDTEIGSLSENAQNYLNRTQDAANRMQNLIRDLLAYSRLNAEVFPLENANLYEIVGEVKADLEELIIEKNAVITVNGDAEVKIIGSQFRQLLTNLMTNSIKFARIETPPQITINNQRVNASEVPFENRNDAQSYSKISVSDNGIGFDNAYKDRIFEVFQRLHTIKDYPGTGIGLAIVKKIIDNHHGFISAESPSDRGAVFTIYLPA